MGCVKLQIFGTHWFVGWLRTYLPVCGESQYKNHRHHGLTCSMFCSCKLVKFISFAKTIHDINMATYYGLIDIRISRLLVCSDQVCLLLDAFMVKTRLLCSAVIE